MNLLGFFFYINRKKMFIDVFVVEILRWVFLFFELEEVHHVIFIGEWPEETTTIKTSERAWACVCVSSGLVNNCRLFSISRSSTAVMAYTNGREEALGGDISECSWECRVNACTGLVSFSVIVLLRVCESCKCVWKCCCLKVFSCVWRTHKQDDVASRKLWSQ